MTLFSSPYIAAAAALVRAEYPGLDNSGVESKLIEISKDLGTSGRDNYFGNGCPVFTQEDEEQPDTEDAVDISEASDVTISGIEDKTYTGQAITQSITVNLGSTTLNPGTDYELSYTNNTDAGTATVTITGKGSYTGSISRSFAISAKTITPSITLSADTFTYDGTAKAPTVTVKDGNTVLDSSQYTVSYSSGRINVGTYTVSVTMKGNYSGSASASFAITAKSITPSITLSNDSYIYDGTVKTPSVTVYDGSKKLSSGYYDVTYQDGRINVGTYSVTVTLKENYSGSASKSFTITEAGEGVTLSLSQETYVYDGSVKTPDATVYYNGEVLPASAYDINYSSGRVNAGTYTVSITLKGNYSGSASKTFEITRKSITPTVILSPSAYTYNGGQRYPTVTVKDGSVTIPSSNYTVTYPSGSINAGGYTVRVTMKGNYAGSGGATYVIYKAGNSLSVYGKTAKVKYKKLRKKAQTLSVSKVLSVYGGEGAITYTKVTGSKKISVDPATGTVKIKKKLKKGKYKVNVLVAASGDTNHSQAASIVTIVIKVK